MSEKVIDKIYGGMGRSIARPPKDMSSAAIRNELTLLYGKPRQRAIEIRIRALQAEFRNRQCPAPLSTGRTG